MATETAQIDKKCYKNQTAGWLGVVKLDHLGAQVGVSIPPHGTEWLTDEEAVLTARAPADAKDNPFVAKTFDFQDEAGQIVQQEMTPLVIVEGERYSPSNERFVPKVAALHPDAQVVAAEADTATALDAESDRPVPDGPEPISEAPQQPQAVPVAQGVLGGSNVRTAPPPDLEAVEGGEKPPQAPAPQPVVAEETVAEETASEETAGEMSTGEETGAAPTPEGQAPQGEFAQHEEVGTPDATTQGEV